MKILFIGTDWVQKWILMQCLFEDSDEELEATIIGQDTPEWFWVEMPRLKEYVGDERVAYQQKSLADFDVSNGLNWDAIYITNTEPESLNILLALADAIKFTGPIILASSWQVYGWKKKKRTPIQETDKDLNPENNMAKRLLALEQVMLKYKSLQTVILRYAEVFGPYMPEGSEVIAMMIDCLSSEEIDVYPPPARNYDWLHVKFIYGLVPKLLKRKFIGGGEVYNIGSGEEKKITWLANALRKLTDSPAAINMHLPEDLYENRGYHSLLDCSKAKQLLQYEPDGIRIQSFLEVCRWVEKDLPPLERAELENKQAPALEDTYPTLKPEWGTDRMQIKEEEEEGLSTN